MRDCPHIVMLSSFKITPLNYPSNMPVEFSLWYQFENASLIMGSEIWLAFTTENGTASCGKKVHKMANLGEVKALTISVRKDQHLSSLKKCRKVPYNDMIIEITLRNLYDKCPFLCKPPLFPGGDSAWIKTATTFGNFWRVFCSVVK